MSSRVISAVLTLKDRNFSSGIRLASNNSKDLQRKVKYAGNAVNHFGKTATSSFKSVANSAMGMAGAIGITKAVSGAINMVRNSVSSAMDRIDVMESFESVMTTLTGSTEKTKAALEATRDAVTGTAYGMDIAAKSVQDFVTRGMDVDKATSTIAAWGDAVAFYGDGSNEQLAGVTDALAKMYSSGKVGMDQMNRLYDAGIDGVGMYAKAVGRDTESVQKDLSSGKISAADFIDVVSEAMMEGTNGVVNISGAAKDAGASWSGSFANMRAAVTRGTTSIIQSFDDMLKAKGLPDMREMVGKFGVKFESALKSAAEKVPLVAGALMRMYEGVKPGVDWLKDTAFPTMKDKIVETYTASKPGLEWLKDTAFPGIVGAVGFVIDKATDLYNFFSDNWSAIGPIVAGVAASIVSFKVGVAVVSTAMKIWNAVTIASQIAMALLNGTLAISPLGWVALAIGAVVAIGIVLWKNWDKIRETAGELWNKVKEVFGGIYDWGMNKIQPVVGFFKGLYDKFMDFKKAITSFKPPEWVSKIGGAIGGAASKVKGFINGSHATGLNSVPYDGYVAELHKGEMVIPERESDRLRQKGANIDNVDQVVTGNNTGRSSSHTGNTVTTTNNQGGANIVIQNLIAKGVTAAEVVNELVPILKTRMANI